MTFKQIIEKTASLLKNDIKWWPYFFFHYTDVSNAVGILEEGCVYSRRKAIEKGLMASDNASADVIRKTNEDVFDFVRLYFRPKTPTQYRNEGYRPLAIRDENTRASCPVPIFFLFDACAVLDNNETFFSEKGLAGAGHTRQFGIEEFSKLNFTKIFHDEWYDRKTDSDIRDYKQSEIVIKDRLRLDDTLYRILCRSEAERETLLFLLRRKSDAIYEKYKGIICYSSKADIYFNNGIFVKNVSYSGSILNICFNDEYQRDRKSAEINMQIEIVQLDDNGNEIVSENIKRSIDFISAAGFEFLIERRLELSKIYVKIMLDEALMYENCIDVTQEVIIV